MAWSDLLTAIGLAAAFEGAVYALLPETARKAFEEMFRLPSATRRGIGLLVCMSGVALVWLVRG